MVFKFFDLNINIDNGKPRLLTRLGEPPNFSQNFTLMLILAPNLTLIHTKVVPLSGMSEGMSEVHHEQMKTMSDVVHSMLFSMLSCKEQRSAD